MPTDKYTHMTDQNTNQNIIRKATEIVMKLRENGFLFYDDTDSFRSCVAKAVSFVIAYHSGYREYYKEEGFFNEWIISYEGKEEDINWFRDNIGRVREVFE